jgi:hypothetical protein
MDRFKTNEIVKRKSRYFKKNQPYFDVDRSRNEHGAQVAWHRDAALTDVDVDIRRLPATTDSVVDQNSCQCRLAGIGRSDDDDLKKR